jgi:hypothetical protein
MNTREKVEAIASEVFAGRTIIFADWFEADRVLERVSFPAIVCVLPSGGSITAKNGRVYDTNEIAIAFIDKAPRDAKGAQLMDIHAKMLEDAVKFCTAVGKSRYFEPIEQAQYTTIYEQLSTIATGVMLQLSLKSKMPCV